jgi:D-alanine-D-alanine ligase
MFPPQRIHRDNRIARDPLRRHPPRNRRHAPNVFCVGRIKLVVLFGGESAEHDVSRVSATHVLRAVDPERYEVIPVGITTDGQWVDAKGAIDSVRLGQLSNGPAISSALLDADGPGIDPTTALTPVEGDQVVVLPILHGPLGEDGTVQGLLELANLPYVGAGVVGSAVAMDKAMAKMVLAANGIDQSRWRTLYPHEVTPSTLDDIVADLGLPLFVKPANMGSSIGVSKAHDRDEFVAALTQAFVYDELVIVEEMIVGREIEVAVLGNHSPRASLPGEITPGGEFYDFADKYETDGATYAIPAPLSADETAEIQRLAIQVFKALRLWGMARIDFFYDEANGRWLCNEANTIPGFTPISMYPKMWQASGLAYPDLIDELVRLAFERHGAKRRFTQR